MNPAYQLHTLLREFGSIPNNLPLRAAKSPDVFRAYVSVINLALEVEERLTAIPNVNVELYQRSIAGIERHLSVTNLEGDLQTFKNGLTSEYLHGLEFISDQFDRIESEEMIPEEDLKKLEKQLDRLIDQVRKADVPAEFCHFLVSHLFIIRTSVQNYRFFGAAGIKSAMARVVGEILLDPRGSTTNEKKKGLVRKVIETIKDANALIKFVRHGAEAMDALPLDDIFRING
jgi:hypothetical protein